MGRVCMVQDLVAELVMGRVCFGPSLSWTEFVMGRDVPESCSATTLKLIQLFIDKHVCTHSRYTHMINLFCVLETSEPVTTSPPSTPSPQTTIVGSHFQILRY